MFQGFHGWPAAPHSNAQYMPITSQSYMSQSAGAVPNFMQFSQHIPPLNNLSAAASTQHMIGMGTAGGVAGSTGVSPQCMTDTLGGKVKVCY